MAAIAHNVLKAVRRLGKGTGPTEHSVPDQAADAKASAQAAGAGMIPDAT